MYVCNLSPLSSPFSLPSLSHPHHPFYMYVLLLSVWSPFSLPLLSLSLLYPILLLLLLIFLCLYVYFYFLPYFWTDLGTVCHSNKSMEKFLTIQSSIYLQTNSKNIFFFIFLFFIFIFLFFYF